MFPKNLLFSFLRTAIWRQAEHVDEITEDIGIEILEEAEKQAVTALVLDAMSICEVKLPRNVVFHYFSISKKVEQDNLRLNSVTKALGKLLSENCVNYVIVKGQVVASLYPKPLMRQSGDIDFYCSKDDFYRAKHVLEKNWNVVFDDTDSERHLHFDYNGVMFELHFTLTSLYDKRKNNYWEQLLINDTGYKVIIDGEPIKTLSPALHTTYVFLHLYNHLMELGVGLRQFCDLALMLHCYKSDAFHETLRKHLKELSLEKAFRACGSVLVHKLGLPLADLPFSLTAKDQRYGAKILDVVFYRGNMGHYNKKSGFHGWHHNVESTGIKLSHFCKFMPLAPKYSCNWITHEISRKIKLKLNKELRK